MKKTLTFLFVACFLLVLSMPVAADDKAQAEDTVQAKYEYVGVKKCMICHKKDSVYPTWLATPHAQAWESLTEENQKKPGCITCHSTGTTAKDELLGGVQCESCHGPGSAYKKMSIMKNREKAIANGLVVADEKTCLICHIKELPEECQSKEPFDFAKMKANGVHVVAEKAEEPKADAEKGEGK